MSVQVNEISSSSEPFHVYDNSSAIGRRIYTGPPRVTPLLATPTEPRNEYEALTSHTDEIMRGSDAQLILDRVLARLRNHNSGS